MKKVFTIAIDGPSGAGKSTISKILARDLKMMYLDTGALFRALAFAALERGIDPQDEIAAGELLKEVDLEIRFVNDVQQVWINAKDVSPYIRTEKVSKAASDISKHPSIRNYILTKERALSDKESFILDGRDIGTVVLPNADVKIFLTASPEIRARRRMLDLEALGEEVDYARVLEDIMIRDNQDKNRATAPAVAAKDAFWVDSGDLSLEETITLIKQIIFDKITKVQEAHDSAK